MKPSLLSQRRLVEKTSFLSWHGAIVRHCDLDPNNHVTNSVTCAWFDDGRYFLFEKHFKPLMETNDFLAVVTLTIDYHHEIGTFDTPKIGSVITKIGNSSVTIGQSIFTENGCVASAQSVTVLADGDSRRPKKINSFQRDALMKFFDPTSS